MDAKMAKTVAEEVLRQHPTFDATDLGAFMAAVVELKKRPDAASDVASTHGSMTGEEETPAPVYTAVRKGARKQGMKKTAKAPAKAEAPGSRFAALGHEAEEKVEVPAPAKAPAMRWADVESDEEEEALPKKKKEEEPDSGGWVTMKKKLRKPTAAPAPEEHVRIPLLYRTSKEAVMMQKTVKSGIPNAFKPWAVGEILGVFGSKITSLQSKHGAGVRMMLVNRASSVVEELEMVVKVPAGSRLPAAVRDVEELFAKVREDIATWQQ